MKKIKNLIEKFKNWLIRTLGGYTEASVMILIDACYEAHMSRLEPWQKTVQEICRRSDNTYYDWCCEYCAENCDKHNGWCRRFEPVGDIDKYE